MSISLNSNSQATQHALSFSSKMKLNQDPTLRMSSGKRIVNSYDDAGQLPVSAKTNSHYKAETHLVQSLSNPLSFLDTQKGLLGNVASILSKFSSLRTNYENSSFTEGVNENYDKIFKELQRELKAISRQIQEFNGYRVNGARSLN
jgi:flagellin-like hook-associated protein FlgL